MVTVLTQPPAGMRCNAVLLTVMLGQADLQHEAEHTRRAISCHGVGNSLVHKGLALLLRHVGPPQLVTQPHDVCRTRAACTAEGGVLCTLAITAWQQQINEFLAGCRPWVRESLRGVS